MVPWSLPLVTLWLSNMMATREVWPFFAIGFALAAISQLTLIALGVIGVALAFIYLNLSKQGGNGAEALQLL